MMVAGGTVVDCCKEELATVFIVVFDIELCPLLKKMKISNTAITTTATYKSGLVRSLLFL